MPDSTDATVTVNAADQSGRSFLWLAWSGIANISSSMLIWVVIAWMRDQDEVGRFSIVMGLYALFFGVVSLGLQPYLINELSRRRSGEQAPAFIGSAATLLFLSGVCTALLMVGGGYLVTPSAEVHAAASAMSLALVPTGLIAICEAVAIADGRSRLVATVTTIENVLKTVIPVALIWSGADLLTIALSYPLVRFIALLIYTAIGKAAIARLAFDRNQFGRLGRTSVTFAVTIAFASLNWQAALLLLGYFSTESEAATFGVASRFLIPVTILMASYSTAIQPELIRRLENSASDFTSYLMSKARLPLIAAISAAVLSPFLSRSLLTLMFGTGYSEAEPVLEMLAISTVPFCIVMMTARGLVAMGRQRVDLIANIIGAAVCVVVAMLLIPGYGAVGAAAAQLVAFAGMAMVEVAYFAREVRLNAKLSTVPVST